MPTRLFDKIFNPQSIAVVGASNNPSTPGHSYTVCLLKYGYKGKIYPVNPNYSEIQELKAYPSLRDISGPVDYVISCVPASAVINMLEDCSKKGVKVVHLFTARFSETGRQDATELEQRILMQARKWGIRLIGPNCLGVYYPRRGISFWTTLPKEPGLVGFVSQSGNAAGNFCRLAPLRGIHFSKVISYGNAIDYDECDFLDYLAHDPETKIILMYVEGVKDGKKFFNSLRHASSSKPVLIIQGGRRESGARAAASHTAALGGSAKIWEAAINQAGAVFAEDLDELIDLAASFHFLAPISGSRVGIAGAAGGPSVIAADQCEEAGLKVIPLPNDLREELKSKGVPVWDWISNPADMTIIEDVHFSPANMLEMMAKNETFDLLISIINEPLRKGISVERYLERHIPKNVNRKPLLAVVADKSLGIDDSGDWSWKLMCEVRTKLIAANIPFYPTVSRAAKAARKLIDYYQKR